ncbi:MAG: hypothetical protein LBM87_00660 [Ruminococcus sp.]|jgi:predicted membrane channel-forming protein YqfA (hemolysin III family)|nr:hypothetical protein [Ruminococcus sp.]
MLNVLKPFFRVYVLAMCAVTLIAASFIIIVIQNGETVVWYQPAISAVAVVCGVAGLVCTVFRHKKAVEIVGYVLAVAALAELVALIKSTPFIFLIALFAAAVFFIIGAIVAKREDTIYLPEKDTTTAAKEVNVYIPPVKKDEN